MGFDLCAKRAKRGATTYFAAFCAGSGGFYVD